MIEARHYLSDVKTRLATSAVITVVEVVAERASGDRGYFPDLSNFPHHVHVGDEKQVVPGRALSILELIDLIEQELDSKLDMSDKG